tara:strand:- start:2736 stop:3842 length:1107 start_codon:yes stop_codon:yes gene_type:complete
MLQPSYQEGLFTAARGIGQAPQMKALQQQQQGQQQVIAEANTALQSNDPAQLTAVSQKLAALGTPEATKLAFQLTQRLNQLQGPEAQLRKIQLEEAQANQQKRLQTERSKNVVAAWTAMGEAERVKFKGKQSVDDQLLIDNAELQDLERQKRVEEIESWQTSKDAPLPVVSVETAISNLADGDIKTALEADLKAVTDQIPAEGKQYSYAGQRSKLAAQIKAINERAFRAIVAEDSARIADERFDRSTIRQVEADIATYRPTKAQVTAKAQELRDEKDKEGRTLFEPKVESFESKAEELLVAAYTERQEGRLKILVPSYKRGEPSEKTKTSTEENEVPTFNSREEALAAKLPIGTEIIIDGRRAVVEQD